MPSNQIKTRQAFACTRKPKASGCLCHGTILATTTPSIAATTSVPSRVRAPRLIARRRLGRRRLRRRRPRRHRPRRRRPRRRRPRRRRPRRRRPRRRRCRHHHHHRPRPRRRRPRRRRRRHRLRHRVTTPSERTLARATIGFIGMANTPSKAKTAAFSTKIPTAAARTRGPLSLHRRSAACVKVARISSPRRRRRRRRLRHRRFRLRYRRLRHRCRRLRHRRRRLRRHRRRCRRLRRRAHRPVLCRRRHRRRRRRHRIRRRVTTTSPCWRRIRVATGFISTDTNSMSSISWRVTTAAFSTQIPAAAPTTSGSKLHHRRCAACVGMALMNNPRHPPRRRLRRPRRRRPRPCNPDSSTLPTRPHRHRCRRHPRRRRPRRRRPRRRRPHHLHRLLRATMSCLQPRITHY